MITSHDYAFTSFPISSSSCFRSGVSLVGLILLQFSISSIVWGRGRLRVSGRRNTRRPTPMDRLPNRIPGSQGTLRACKKHIHNRIPANEYSPCLGFSICPKIISACEKIKCYTVIKGLIFYIFMQIPFLIEVFSLGLKVKFATFSVLLVFFRISTKCLPQGKRMAPACYQDGLQEMRSPLLDFCNKKSQVNKSISTMSLWKIGLCPYLPSR